MKHPLPLLITSLFVFILGTSMLRNATCPCGVPATVSDVSTTAPTSAAGVAMTASYVEPTAVAVAAAPTIDAARIQSIETRLRAKELVLYFDYDQPTTSLSAAQRKELEDVQYYIAQNPESNIKVTGHTDSRGAADYNAQLSVSRAHFVTDYLIGLGANVQKFTTEGKGEATPASTNSTSKGRAKNRRVVISLS